MIDVIHFFALGALCLGIVLACVCRLNMIRLGVHRTMYAAMYIALAYFAGGTLADALSTHHFPDPWVLAGLVASLASILATLDRWSNGPPWAAQKPHTRHERRSRA
jgi:hypothetical protein